MWPLLENVVYHTLLLVMLLNLPISSRSFLVDALGFFKCTRVSPADKQNLLLSINMHGFYFLFLPYCIVKGLKYDVEVMRADIFRYIHM